MRRAKKNFLPNITGKVPNSIGALRVIRYNDMLLVNMIWLIYRM